jgi:secondary thiamine-phosphate synthase enzyme
MISNTRIFSIKTHGKGLTEITAPVEEIVRESGVKEGTATVFVRHTSASLVIFENADPSAARDLEMFFERMVPESGQGFMHTMEGPDDMTSHIRMVLTRTSEVIPIVDRRLGLGTWQGVFLFEHRRAPHSRSILVNVTGVP